MEKLNAHMIDSAAMYLEGELEQMMPDVLRQEYANLWAEEALYFPAPMPLDYGTTELTFELIESVGKARETDDYGDDIPLVSTGIAEERYNVYHFDLGMQYNIVQLARDAKAGRSLNAEKMIAVDRGLRERVHQQLVFGDRRRGGAGLFNNPNVPVIATGYNPTTATWRQHLDFFTGILTDIEVDSFLTKGTDFIFIPKRLQQYLVNTYQSNDSGLNAMEAIIKSTQQALGNNALQGLVAVNECSAPLLERFGVKNPGEDLDRIVFMPSDSSVIKHARYATTTMEPERRAKNFKVLSYNGTSEMIITAPNELRYVDIPTLTP